jgi:hypothetical protein
VLYHGPRARSFVLVSVDMTKWWRRSVGVIVLGVSVEWAGDAMRVQCVMILATVQREIGSMREPARLS